MLDKDYRIKCIPHPQSEFKYIFPYRTERELYTYKSQKTFPTLLPENPGQAVLPYKNV